MRKRNLIFGALTTICVIAVVAVAGFGMFGEEGLCWVLSDTAYAPGFSESAYASINIGMSRDAVLAHLGNPFWVQRGSDVWVYRRVDGTELHLAFSLSARGTTFSDNPVCDDVSEAAVPTSASASYTSAGVTPLWSGPDASLRNKSAAEILKLRGEPDRRIAYWPELENWHYTESPSGSHFIRRSVYFTRSTGVVEGFGAGVHWD